MTAFTAHLVRHGEVENPHHVVYADLPGYHLSSLGVVQAQATAEHLAAAPIRAVVSSPLLRARQTATVIAAAHGLEEIADDRLTEWTLALRWAGVRWEEVDDIFPGEMRAYLDHPEDLSFAPESLQQCGARVVAVVREWIDRVGDGHLVVVSHQDPIHAGAAALTKGRTDPDPAAKPTHGSVITVAHRDSQWRRVDYWEPPQSTGFPPVG